MILTGRFCLYLVYFDYSCLKVLVFQTNLRPLLPSFAKLALKPP